MTGTAPNERRPIKTGVPLRNGRKNRPKKGTARDPQNLFAVLVFVIWLYATLVLAEGRAGYIIILLGSLLGLLVPVIHMKGARGVLGGTEPS
jgi:hypothetical protein